MPEQAWISILDHKPTLHRHDCEVFDTLLAEPAATPADDVAARGSDAILRYGLAVRPSYEVFKRTVGQLSGLLILIYGSRRRDVLDIQVVTAAREQFREGRETLLAVRPPAAARAHHATLVHAAQLLQGGFDLLDQKDFLRSDDKRSELSSRLQAAHRLIQSASDERFAMAMVDFSHACCSCGAAARRGRGQP
jgi:hypothetical protein